MRTFNGLRFHCVKSQVDFCKIIKIAAEGRSGRKTLVIGSDIDGSLPTLVHAMGIISNGHRVDLDDLARWESNPGGTWCYLPMRETTSQGGMTALWHWLKGARDTDIVFAWTPPTAIRSDGTRYETFSQLERRRGANALIAAAILVLRNGSALLSDTDDNIVDLVLSSDSLSDETLTDHLGSVCLSAPRDRYIEENVVDYSQLLSQMSRVFGEIPLVMSALAARCYQYAGASHSLCVARFFADVWQGLDTSSSDGDRRNTLTLVPIWDLGPRQCNAWETDPSTVMANYFTGGDALDSSNLDFWLGRMDQAFTDAACHGTGGDEDCRMSVFIFNKFQNNRLDFMTPKEANEVVWRQ